MPLPVISVAQMREWEKATWATGQTEGEVIRRVGACIGKRAMTLTALGDRVLILCGKGHNGDDARNAQACITDRQVDLLELTDPAGQVSKLERALASRPRLVIDGVFGIGLNRELDAGWLNVIRVLNEARLPVLAIDVPSGLNADTGQTWGGAVNAAVTMTVGAPKIGMLEQNAWPFVGRLEVAIDVGLSPLNLATDLRWTLPSDFLGFPPERHAASHKGSFGHVGIFAGSLGYHGAAVLAARGAQRAQPGLITLHTFDTVYHAIASQLQAVMVSPSMPASRVSSAYSALAVGPGLADPGTAEPAAASSRQVWRDSHSPVVMDASALDWLSVDPFPKGAIRVLTPHPGEAARLLKSTPQQVQANRPGVLRHLSKRFGNCWIVLKGHQTLVGRSTGEIFVNSSGNPHLAQGGSGDLLSGYLAGLLAQPALRADPLLTLRYAVWQHGAAADLLQSKSRNWTVEDLAMVLGNA